MRLAPVAGTGTEEGNERLVFRPNGFEGGFAIGALVGTGLGVDVAEATLAQGVAALVADSRRIPFLVVEIKTLPTLSHSYYYALSFQFVVI